MSGPTVELLLGVHVERDEFLDVVATLGGERYPDEWTDGQLSRDSRTVWISVDPPDESEPEDVASAEQLLGGPIGTRVLIQCSKAVRSDRLALEVIEAAARRWPLVIDTLYGYAPLDERIVTVDALRSRDQAGKPYLFYEALPPPEDAPVDDERGC